MAGRKKVPGHVQRGGKSLMVQRQFAKLGIPRMYRSSGTLDKNEFAAINTLLTELARSGTPQSVELLHKLNRGEVSFLNALGDFRKTGLKVADKYGSSDALIDRRFFVSWLKERYPRENTRESYFNQYRTLAQFAEYGETMKDLPVIMDRYRVWCVKNGRNFRAFNYALAVCQAWVRDTLGDDGETYRKLRKVERFKIKNTARNKPYFSPRDIMNVVQKLPDDVGAQFWSMALYGLGPKEAMEDGFTVEGEGVHIHGQKHEHRDRIVPLLPNHKPAAIALHEYRTLYLYIRKASKSTMTPYTARNCYPRWMTAAGVPYNRVRMYQGHAERDQTDTYAFHQTQKLLAVDAAMMEKWLQEQLASEPASDDVTKVTVGAARGWSKTKRGSYRDEIAAVLENHAKLAKPRTTA